MGRNVVLGCLSCPCFKSPGKAYANNGFAADANNGSSSDSEVRLPPSGVRASSLSGNGFSADTGSSPDPEVRSSRIDHEVPSYKLVPLPQDRAFPAHPVGIDDEVKNVIRLLEWEDETNVKVAVILHGFGGTGKTTLADAVVATLDIQGWNCSTLVPFQSMGNFEDGPEEIQDQVFIFIDNVTVQQEQLEKLLPKPCKKLRLLLTARDEAVADVIRGWDFLTHVYPVRPLHSQDAMELLCSKIGVQISPQHMEEILKICDGVPVVLKRVGAFICQSPDKDEAYRGVIEWSRGGKPFTSVQEYSIEEKGLLFDLEELPASAKDPFLDICFFFNGWDWNNVSCIMGEDGLNILRKRALFLKKEENENKAMFRPIILTIGRNMAKGKRFTSAHDLTKVLEADNLDDIGGIKGIWLQDNNSEPFLMSAKKLDLMHNSMRVLALGDMSIIVDGPCTQKFKQIVYFQAGKIPCIPFHPSTLQELRYLDWLPTYDDDLQLNKMSSKLQVLDLNGDQHSRIVDSESVFSRLERLRTLKLASFTTRKNLSEEHLSLTQLEELDLTGCGKLRHLPKGLGNLKALTKLRLRLCRSLQELPDCFGNLGSLKYLDLNSCISLEHLPKDFGLLTNLEELDLGSGGLKELPTGFEKLSTLKVLNLSFCRNLEYLPDNIGDLSALVRVSFNGSGLISIPPSLQRLSCFPLSVEHCLQLTDLPEAFCSYLELVKDLSFKDCFSLTNLPKQLVELASLTRLDLHYCGSLERLPEGFSQLKSLATLNLEMCHSLQQLSDDFHCLASLRSLNMRWCLLLRGEWMDTVAKIKTLDLVDIIRSEKLVERWKEMEREKEEEGESWQFAVRTGDKVSPSSQKWKTILNKAASKLLTGKCLLTDSHANPFSLSTVAPNTPLLIMYEYKWKGPWRLLEEIVLGHDHLLMPFQMIYVGNHFGKLSKKFKDRILSYASPDSDAFSLFHSLLEDTGDVPFPVSPNFVLTEVVTDKEGNKHFFRWEDITHSCVEFFLSKSSLCSDLKKLTETPQESSEKLLRTLINAAESSAVFLRNYTENMGVDQLRGKTLLLLISFMDVHPFQSLKEIYSKFKASDNLEILSIPIPVEVRRRLRKLEQHQAVQPGSDLAGFERILRNVPWPVLRNPWLLRTEACYFLEREWGELNPAIVVVMDPNGRICNKNAVPLIETWGAQMCPFTDEKMRQLEQEPPEEHLSEYILHGLREKGQYLPGFQYLPMNPN